MKTIADYLANPNTPNTPNTPNIDEYLAWLERHTGPFGGLDPHRLAALSITLYRQYQRDPEHRRLHGLPPL
jgi:hypothetical protein